VFALSRVMFIVLPVIVALLLATVLGPPAAWLQRRRVPDALAALLLVAGLVALVVGLLAVITPQVAEELGDVADELAEGFEQFLDWVGDSPVPVNREQIDQLIEQGLEAIRDNPRGLTDGVLAGAYAAFHGAAGLILSIVLLFFFLKDGEQITRWLVARTNRRWREELRAVGGRAWGTLGSYIRGTAIVGLVDAVGIGVGLLLIGVPLVLPLMLLTFFGGFFPLIGATLAGFVAVLVALVALGPLEALLTLAVVVAVQQLESNILEPMVLGRAVRLHPVVVLLALMAGGVLAGVIGAFLAVPVAAVSASVGNEIRLRRQRD
jgi:putative heme transporter